MDCQSPLHPPTCRKARRPDRSVRCRFSDGFLDWSRGIDHWTATPVDGLKKPTKNNPYTPNVNLGHDRLNWLMWKALFFLPCKQIAMSFNLWGKPMNTASSAPAYPRLKTDWMCQIGCNLPKSRGTRWCYPLSNINAWLFAAMFLFGTKLQCVRSTEYFKP